MSPQPSNQVHMKSDKQSPKHSAIRDKLQLEPNATTNRDNPNGYKEDPHPHTVKESMNPHGIHTNSQTINPDLPMQSTNKQSCLTTIAMASPGQNNTNISDPGITMLKQGRTHKSPHMPPYNTTTTGKGDSNMDENHTLPNTSEEKINPHSIHTNTMANEQKLPMPSTSTQPYPTLTTDVSPGYSSTEQEDTHKLPRTRPNNTQIIIDRRESSNTNTASHNAHPPTIITITSSEDNSGDGIEEINIQDNNPTKTSHRGWSTSQKHVRNPLNPRGTFFAD